MDLTIPMTKEDNGTPSSLLVVGSNGNGDKKNEGSGDNSDIKRLPPLEEPLLSVQQSIETPININGHKTESTVEYPPSVIYNNNSNLNSNLINSAFSSGTASTISGNENTIDSQSTLPESSVIKNNNNTTTTTTTTTTNNNNDTHDETLQEEEDEEDAMDINNLPTLIPSQLGAVKKSTSNSNSNKLLEPALSDDENEVYDKEEEEEDNDNDKTDIAIVQETPEKDIKNTTITPIKRNISNLEDLLKEENEILKDKKEKQEKQEQKQDKEIENEEFIAPKKSSKSGSKNANYYSYHELNNSKRKVITSDDINSNGEENENNNSKDIIIEGDFITSKKQKTTETTTTTTATTSTTKKSTPSKTQTNKSKKAQTTPTKNPITTIPVKGLDLAISQSQDDKDNVLPPKPTNRRILLNNNLVDENESNNKSKLLKKQQPTKEKEEKKVKKQEQQEEEEEKEGEEHEEEESDDDNKSENSSDEYEKVIKNKKNKKNRNFNKNNNDGSDDSSSDTDNEHTNIKRKTVEYLTKKESDQIKQKEKELKQKEREKELEKKRKLKQKEIEKEKEKEKKDKGKKQLAIIKYDDEDSSDTDLEQEQHQPKQQRLVDNYEKLQEIHQDDSESDKQESSSEEEKVEFKRLKKTPTKKKQAKVEPNLFKGINFLISQLGDDDELISNSIRDGNGKIHGLNTFFQSSLRGKFIMVKRDNDDEEEEEEVEDEEDIKIPRLIFISKQVSTSVKYIRAIIENIPCVSKDWILECVDKGKLVEITSDFIQPIGASLLNDKPIYVSDYDVGDFDVSSIFHDFRIELFSSKKPINTFKDDWSIILKKCGAKIVQRMLSVSGGRIDAILLDGNVGTYLLDTMSTKLKIPIVSTTWVIQSIIHKRKLPYDLHPLFLNQSSSN